MLTSKNIALQIEQDARDIFYRQQKELPKHFEDWQISSNYVSTLFELLHVHFQNELPDTAHSFIKRHSVLAQKSIRDIGEVQADNIRKEFENLLK